MKVVFIASEPTIASLFLPIAQAFRKISPATENILINPSKLLFEQIAGEGSPVDVFCQQGFDVEEIQKDDYRDLVQLDFETKAYLFYFRLYKRLKPSVIVVPHEFGYAFYAVQAAKLLGVATYHIQHGIWGPYRFFHREDKTVLSINVNKATSLKKVRSYVAGIIRGVLTLISVKGRAEKPYDLSLLDNFRGMLPSPPPGVSYVVAADRMAVWGPYYGDLLLEAQPRLKGRLDVVGYITGDSFYRDPVESREAIYNKYGLDRNGKLAVYFYVPFQVLPEFYTLRHHPTDVLIDTIRQLKKIESNINVLVALHPNYRFNHYKKQLSAIIQEHGFSKVNIDLIHNDHFSLYKAASLIIGVKSTMFYEAMLINTIGVVQSYVLTEIDDPQHIEGGAVVPVFCPKHLRKQLRMALTDRDMRTRIRQNQRMVCEELLGPFDGKCGDRVAQAIIDLVGRTDTNVLN